MVTLWPILDLVVDFGAFAITVSRGRPAAVGWSSRPPTSPSFWMITRPVCGHLQMLVGGPKNEAVAVLPDVTAG